METETTFTLKDPQGFEIFVYKWAPQPGVAVKAVVQIAHGAADPPVRRLLGGSDTLPGMHPSRSGAAAPAGGRLPLGSIRGI